MESVSDPELGLSVSLASETSSPIEAVHTHTTQLLLPRTNFMGQYSTLYLAKAYMYMKAAPGYANTNGCCSWVHAYSYSIRARKRHQFLRAVIKDVSSKLMSVTM